MIKQDDPYFLIQLVLAGPSEKRSSDKIPAVLVLLQDFLKQISPNRRFTDLSAALCGSEVGLICTFSVVPAAQSYMDVCQSTHSASELAKKVIQEKDQWVVDLNNLPIELLSKSVMQASGATVRYRANALLAGRTTTQDLRMTKELLTRLRTFEKSKLRGYVGSYPFQLQLAEFNGYSWSQSKMIRALPRRERYGASLTLLSEVSFELFDKKNARLQLHYSDVSDAHQLQIDRACKTGSQIEAIVQIARQQGRASMAKIQKLISSGNDARDELH